MPPLDSTDEAVIGATVAALLDRIDTIASPPERTLTAAYVRGLIDQAQATIGNLYQIAPDEPLFAAIRDPLATAAGVQLEADPGVLALDDAEEQAVTRLITMLVARPSRPTTS